MDHVWYNETGFNHSVCECDWNDIAMSVSYLPFYLFKGVITLTLELQHCIKVKVWLRHG